MIDGYQITDRDGLPVVVGYQFIRSDGFPVGNIQPTLEDAEEVARSYDAGRFYSVKMTKFQFSMRYLYRKGLT